MCLAVIALGAHPRLPLVIAANRDEFHERAARPAHWWDDGILAGRDAVGAGTWFGITRTGRWALITNFREGTPRDPNAPSRGALVTMALRSNEPPMVCAARIAADSARYHGFNLLVGDAAVSCAYASNRASGARALGTGFFGLSNHFLDTAWPKVVQAKARLAAALDTDAERAAGGDPDPCGELIADAFALLADRREASTGVLPSTGVSPEWERLLSPAFIASPAYGTRCSTVLALDAGGGVGFVERSFDPWGTALGEVTFDFRIERAARAAIA
ncbi:MAG: NRDE family protein [Betaproteobacteria bacterium]